MSKNYFVENFTIDSPKIKTILNIDGPVFLYNLDIISSNIRSLEILQNNQSKIFYSVKSNPNIHLLKYIKELNCGFDVSSSNELDSVLDLGIDPKMITLSGPAKTSSCISKALNSNIFAIHLDSIDEFKCYIKLNENIKNDVKLSLRVSLKDNIINKLGMNFSEIESLLSNTNTLFCGFHFYLNRDSYNYENALDIIEHCLTIKSQFQNRFIESEFQFFLGTGLPDLKTATSLNLFAKSFSHIHYPVNLELGRSIVGNAGIFSSNILSIKNISPDESIIIIDGGLQHLASKLASPKYEMQNIHYSFIRKGKILDEKKTIRCSVAGSLSIWHDVLLDKINVPVNLMRGDRILLSPCGAYGLTAASSQFIGPSRCREYALKDNDENVEDVSAKYLTSYQLGFEV